MAAMAAPSFARTAFLAISATAEPASAGLVETAATAARAWGAPSSTNHARLWFFPAMHSLKTRLSEEAVVPEEQEASDTEGPVSMAPPQMAATAMAVVLGVGRA
jgi:hypothetical protein